MDGCGGKGVEGDRGNTCSQSKFESSNSAGADMHPEIAHASPEGDLVHDVEVGIGECASDRRIHIGKMDFPLGESLKRGFEPLATVAVSSA